MKLVPLYNRRHKLVVGHAMVDDADYDLVMTKTWSMLSTEGLCYAICKTGPSKMRGRGILLHRFLNGLQGGDSRCVDHIDRNGLNCQRDNMRVCTILENSHNRGPAKRNNLGVRGVSYCPSIDKYKAQLTVAGNRVWSTRHDLLDDAIAAIKEANRLYGIPGFTPGCPAT